MITEAVSRNRHILIVKLPIWDKVENRSVVNVVKK